MTPTNPPLQSSDAFARLFEQHHMAVFRFIFGLSGGTLHEVEDLTAETFMRAWKARERFDGDLKYALAWLLTIARNLVIDTARRRKFRQGEQFISDIDEYQQLFLKELSESTEAQVLRHEQVKLLMHQLSYLSSERRELLILRYILGWPVKDIATHLGMVENTVSVYLHRALEKIRNNWPGSEI